MPSTNNRPVRPLRLIAYSAWGFDVHRFIVGRALDILPERLRPFYEKYRAFGHFLEKPAAAPAEAATPAKKAAKASAHTA